MHKKIGIIGAAGFVGKAMRKLFPDAVVYDIVGDLKDNKKKINECDAVFVCVPTNLQEDGTLDMSIVEEVVSWCEAPLIIIRSTLQPGFSQYLKEKYNKKISVVPEYVGETANHPLLEEKDRPFLVIGGDLEVRRQVIDIFTTVYNANITIRQVSNYAAEIIKLCENRAIAFKVMQMHELYEICKAANVDYYTIRDVVYGDDPRMNLWFTLIYKDENGKEILGFNSSKCLVKDVPAFCSWAESMGGNPDITKFLVNKSNEYARSKGN